MPLLNAFIKASGGQVLHRRLELIASAGDIENLPDYTAA
jgi:hypothetical protein